MSTSRKNEFVLSCFFIITADSEMWGSLITGDDKTAARDRPPDRFTIHTRSKLSKCWKRWDSNLNISWFSSSSDDLYIQAPQRTATKKMLNRCYNLKKINLSPYRQWVMKSDKWDGISGEVFARSLGGKIRKWAQYKKRKCCDVQYPLQCD